MKYYPIDESAARRAKQANSLSDYAEGSATSEYRREVNRAATLAEECKKGKTEAQQEKIDYLLDRYAHRLADNMNASNRNRASCPSVMVAGWSNFPVRKKQQQLSRDDTLMREWRDIQGILDQIRAVGHGGISGMDADARERVQAKLTEREAMQEKMKSVNAYWRKYGALVGCPGLSDKEVARLTASASQSASTGRSEPPYPRWALDNNGAEIRRLRSRLAVLDAQQAQGDSEQTFTGGVLRITPERVQLVFDDKPAAEIRDIVKQWGFRWAPSQGAWQRQNTANGRYAANQAIKAIEEVAQ